MLSGLFISRDCDVDGFFLVVRMFTKDLYYNNKKRNM